MKILLFMELSKSCNLALIRIFMFEYIFRIDKGVPIDVGLDFGKIRLFSREHFGSHFSLSIPTIKYCILNDMTEVNTVGMIQSISMIIMISASTTAEYYIYQ